VRRYVITPEAEPHVAAALAQAFDELAREEGWDATGSDGRHRPWAEAAIAEAVGCEADAAPA
jgi:hypothetical protein